MTTHGAVQFPNGIGISPPPNYPHRHFCGSLEGWMPDALTTGIPDLMQDKGKPDPLPHPNQRVPLAYENKKFLNGPDGRILRILAEYQEPLSKFRREKIQ